LIKFFQLGFLIIFNKEIGMNKIIVGVSFLFACNLAMAEDLKLVDWSCGDPITGVVKNLSKKSYRTIMLKVPLYDASGAKVGDAHAIVNGLGAGETWKFEAPTLMKKFDKCGSPELKVY
jgi:hypothetical protein